MLPLPKLRDEGYTVLNSAVQRPLIEEARAIVDDDIARRGATEVGKCRKGDTCPDLAMHPALHALFTMSSLWSTVKKLSDGRAPLWPMPCGVSVVMPGAAQGEMHIDGLPGPDSGVEDLWPFHLLVGVALTDTLVNEAGNFTVWPCSHRKVAEHVKSFGASEIRHGNVPRDEYGPAVPVLMSAGDAVLASHLLVHASGENRTTTPRTVVFFRVRLDGIAEESLDETFYDPWAHLPGVWA